MTESFRPAARLREFSPYKPKKATAAPTYKVDANEASASSYNLERYLRSIPAEALNRYTRPQALEAALAERFGVTQDRVVVTAGADDGLMRLCLLAVEPGRQAVLTTPSFEMIPRYVTLTGGEPVAVDWFGGPAPTDALVEAVGPKTSIVFLVTPSSPAGQSADIATVQRLAERCAEVGALLLIDHAYVEFSDSDFTAAALELPNTVVARTFSKAWGLAGLRVGYFLGPASTIEWMKAVGQPYAVATPSVYAACAMLAEGDGQMRMRVAKVKDERRRLSDLLNTLGAQPIRSDGNSVLARLGPAGEHFQQEMAGQGISVRLFDRPKLIAGSVRITCPGDDQTFEALMRAIPSAVASAMDAAGMKATILEARKDSETIP